MLTEPIDAKILVDFSSLPESVYLALDDDGLVICSWVDRRGNLVAFDEQGRRVPVSSRHREQGGGS